MSNYQLHLGDCLQSLREMPDNSVDAIVTDPPYGLTANKKGGTGVASVNLESPYGRARIGAGNGPGGFMGHKWDSDVPSVEIWAKCLRVLKPGGYLLAFAGTRTQHRMAVRIEEAGFEIRDMIAWVYGSGFPKSHNLGGEWKGWGTALKPALEPITVARKPLAGTVAANVLEHGTGALNIDGCRVEPTGESRERVGEDSQQRRYTDAGGTNFAALPGVRGGDPAGRWPANLIHDGSDEVLAAFPQAPGQMAKAAEGGDRRKDQNVYGAMTRGSNGAEPRADSGSAARFFYCAKASKRDRDDGLEGFAPAKTNDGRKVDADNAYQRGATLRANIHPTVKPTDLMRYLCRLVTPPGGVVLDPFMGSGSTGKAAMLEGFCFIGCELSPEYLAIAQARIEAAEKSVSVAAMSPQLDLFAEAA